ncbi:MAG: nuclease-related domain-containing protein, partial [Candidatus Paceibacterota bacterium]
MQNVIYLVIFFGIIILCKIVMQRLPAHRGAQGERFVAKKLRRELDPAHYVILNDLMLPAQGGVGTAQIDHIVVSNFGIFCIETKSYVGPVYGDARAKQWTQYFSGQKKPLYNPIYQNNRHVEAIKDLLLKSGMRAVVYPFIVFPNRDFKVKIYGTSIVGRTGETIEKILGYREQIYSDAEKNKIVALLASKNITTKDSRRQHNS